MANYCTPAPGAFSNVNLNYGYAVNRSLNGILRMMCNYGFSSSYNNGTSIVTTYEMTAWCTGYNNTNGAWNPTKPCARVYCLLFKYTIKCTLTIFSSNIQAYPNEFTVHLSSSINAA